MLSSRVAGRLLLLVEDDFLTCEAVTLCLAGEGYMVAVAANGGEALQRLHNHCRPDLILLDLSMPKMDGLQFRQEQARHKDLARIPVLVISASADLRQQADALGAAGYLQKPVETEHLLDAVRRCCADSPGPAGRESEARQWTG